MAARVVLLADGEVGARVLRLLLDRSPCPLVGLGMVGASGLGADADLAPSIACARWERSQTAALAHWVRSLQPDLLLLAWWPFIIKAEVLNAGQSATLNLHPSLLGEGRGKDPNFWALADQVRYGVTIHHVTERVDEGPIAFQAPLGYDWTDTGATLYRRAQDAIVSLFSDRLDDILALRLPRIEQPASTGTTRRRADLDARCALSLDAPTTARALLNLLRARTFPPHPGCRFEADGQVYEVQVSIVAIEQARGT